MKSNACCIKYTSLPPSWLNEQEKLGGRWTRVQQMCGHRGMVIIAKQYSRLTLSIGLAKVAMDHDDIIVIMPQTLNLLQQRE